MGISEEDYAVLCGRYLHNHSCNILECTPRCPVTVLATTLLIANGGSAFQTPRWKAGTLYCQSGTLNHAFALPPFSAMTTAGDDIFFSDTLHHSGCKPWVCAVSCPLRVLVSELFYNAEEGHSFNEPGVMSRAENYVKLGVININEIPHGNERMVQSPPVSDHIVPPPPGFLPLFSQFVTHQAQQPSAVPYIGYPLQRAAQITFPGSCSKILTGMSYGYNGGHIISSPIPSAIAALTRLVHNPSEIYRVFHSYPEYMKQALSFEVRQQTGFHLRLGHKRNHHKDKQYDESPPSPPLE